MRNARVVGICSLVLGALLIADHYVSDKPEMWRLYAGVVVLIIGVIQLVRAGRVRPPVV